MKSANFIIASALVVSHAFSPAFAQDASDATSASPAMARHTKKDLRKINWQTEKIVRKAFASTKGLDSSNISVIARGNKVILGGTVRQDSQIALAENSARDAVNDKSVVNNITVKGPGN